MKSVAWISFYTMLHMPSIHNDLLEEGIPQKFDWGFKCFYITKCKVRHQNSPQ